MFTVSVQELLIWLKKQVDFGGDEESLFLLLDILGGLSKKDLIALKINPQEKIKLKVSLNNIANRWIEHITTSRPIQQICESTYWRGLKIKINSDVLIPRVETEMMVDIVNNLFPSPKESIYFADLGTGSGAIAIALALLNPRWIGFATDFDKKAYGQHINIVDKVFQFLSTRKKKIPSNFMKEQLKGLEKDHGNVDLLSHRLSIVRTWSYVANKKNWDENSDYWEQWISG